MEGSKNWVEVDTGLARRAEAGKSAGEGEGIVAGAGLGGREGRVGEIRWLIGRAGTTRVAPRAGVSGAVRASLGGDLRHSWLCRGKKEKKEEEEKRRAR